MPLKDGNNLHFPTRISERSKADIRNAVTSLLVWIPNQFREAMSEHSPESTYHTQKYGHNTKEAEVVKNFKIIFFYRVKRLCGAI